MYHNIRLYLSTLNEFLKNQQYAEENQQTYRSKRHDKLWIMTHPEPGHKRFDEPNADRHQELNNEKRWDCIFVWYYPDKQVHDQRTVYCKFKVTCSKYEPKIEATVIQYHNFMNHGEFQVSLRIIDRHAAAFNHCDHNNNKSCHCSQCIADLRTDVKC